MKQAPVTNNTLTVERVVTSVAMGTAIGLFITFMMLMAGIIT